MELSEVFTKKNIEILRLLFEENLHIRDIANRLGISPGKVHNSIKIFKKNNLVIETKEKNKKIISLNKNNTSLNEINNLINEKEGLKEIILAFAASPQGEHTESYLRKILAPLSIKHGLKISSLGRGLSTGAELEYTDPDTLKNALKNRS